MSAPETTRPPALRRLRVALALSTVLGLGACDALLEHLPQNLGNAEQHPAVTVGTLQMRHGPSLNELAAYYCPLVISDSWVRLGCAVALGSPPPRNALTFEFGITLEIHNPNDFPVPAADVLLGLTLFDGLDAEAVGAICISLCGQDDPECTGAPRPGACEAQAGDILTLDDFVAALPGLIADIASGRAAEELRNSTILAGGNITLDLSFLLGVDQALSVFQKTAFNYVDALLEGRDATLSVPVSAAGTVFFRLPVLGRIGVGYGPFASRWDIL
jgi:hypothetical protein